MRVPVVLLVAPLSAVLTLSLVHPKAAAARVAQGQFTIHPSHLAKALRAKLYSMLPVQPSPSGQLRTWLVSSQPVTAAHALSLTMHVTAGWSGIYNERAWTPVRVTLVNHSRTTIRGTVVVPDANNGMGLPQPFHTLYQASVVLPVGITRSITLYIPGPDVQGVVHVSFQAAGRTLATASAYPLGFSQDALGGILTGNSASMSWTKRVDPTEARIVTVRLTPSALTMAPQALASFDVIILTHFNTASFDRNQVLALEQYVRNGGALLLIGGSHWRETLLSLPAALLPGRLVGSRMLPDLSGLRTLGAGVPPRRSTVVSILAKPHGVILAAEAGIPLVARMNFGSGHIVYLAFDPATDPIQRWAGAADLLSHLIAETASSTMSRASLPAGSMLPMFIGPYGPLDIDAELANVPAAALPSLILFVALTLLYIFLVGPVNFLILRRFHRLELSWITIPALAFLCVGSSFGLARHLKGNTVLLNIVSVVQFHNNNPSTHADAALTTFYVGLFAPTHGDYRLTYSAPALPAAVTTYDAPWSQLPSAVSPLGLRFEEGRHTQVQFVSMNMWSMRDVAFNTMLKLPGTIQSNLWLDATGDIVGTIHNGTKLKLIHSGLIAGRAIARLPTLRPDATIQVHIRPDADIYGDDNSSIWLRLYGQPSFSGSGLATKRSDTSQLPFLSSMGCCPGGSPAPERTLLERIRNVLIRLPEVQTSSIRSEVMLIAWNQQHLGSFMVDGITPQRRDLNLIVVPLTVHFPLSSFHLRSGTLGARLVETLPMPSSGCCVPGIQSTTLSDSGSAIFEFDIPATRSIHFRALTLWVDTGGADGSDVGSVYNWRTAHWDRVNLGKGDAHLRSPDRYLSPTGALLVKLQATTKSGPITIRNPLDGLQLSGMAVAHTAFGSQPFGVGHRCRLSLPTKEGLFAENCVAETNASLMSTADSKDVTICQKLRYRK
jgi:hypothetical protein